MRAPGLGGHPHPHLTTSASDPPQGRAQAAPMWAEHRAVGRHLLTECRRRSVLGGSHRRTRCLRWRQMDKQHRTERDGEWGRQRKGRR